MGIKNVESSISNIDLNGFQISYYTQASPKRKKNEDSILAESRNLFTVIAVADGAGGHASGDLASNTAINVLRKQISSITLENRVQIIYDVFRLANEKISAFGTGSATTMTVGLLWDSFGQFFHVGDSHALVISGKGSIKYATTGHSEYDHAVQAGLEGQIKNQSAESDLRSTLTNIIGTPEMYVEVGPTIKLAQRDKIIIASDGIHDNFDIIEHIESLKNKKTSYIVSSSFAKINQLFSEKPTQASTKFDDVSVVAVRRNVKLKK